MEVQEQPVIIKPLSNRERRQRLREILKVVTKKLKEKDGTSILHRRPCSLLYPNYNFDKHFDMTMVEKRINQMCYYNVYQYRQAIAHVVKCQTDFFPMNTVRYEFSVKFDQYARKQTTYRTLVVLCAELDIKDDMPKSDLRDMLVGTDLTSENEYKENNEEIKTPMSRTIHSIDSSLISTTSEEIFKRREADNFTTLSIASGGFNEAHMNGKPVVLEDLTGKVIGAPSLPRRTRTIEDKAYTVSYLSYGVFGTYGPAYDSRSATISKDDSDLLFKNNTDDYESSLENITNLSSIDGVSYLANRILGNEAEAELLLVKNSEITPDPLSLLELEREGIDVSFLEAFDPNKEIQFNGNFGQALSELSVVLPELSNIQDKRLLSNSAPDHIDSTELKTAEIIQRGLCKIIRQVEPGAICSVQGIRKALGVKY